MACYIDEVLSEDIGQLGGVARGRNRGMGFGTEATCRELVVARRASFVRTLKQEAWAVRKILW
jgi:hypothetical protein